MRKRYLSIFLAAAIVLSQAAGTGCFVQAAEHLSGEESGGGDWNLEESEQFAELKEKPEEHINLEEPEQFAELEEKPDEHINLEKPVQTSETGEHMYRPSFALPNQIQVFPGFHWSGTISKKDSGFWISGEDKRVPMEITNAVSADDKIAALQETESAWEVIGGECGETDITITCVPDMENVISPDDAAINIKPETVVIHVIVDDKDYRIQIVNSDTGINKMLPGASVNLAAEVSLDYLINDGEIRHYEKVTDADVVWKAESEDTEFEAVTGTGNSFQVKAPDNKEGDYTINVTAEVRDDGKVAASYTYTLEVKNLYYVLDPGEPEGTEGIWPGETVTIEPLVYRYEKGKEPEVESGCQYIFYFSEENFRIEKDNVLVEREVAQEEGSFTVKRLNNSYFSGIDIYAMKEAETICNKTLSFKEKSYSYIPVEGGWGDSNWYKWIFVDDDNPEETEEKSTFTLDTDKIGGEYEIEWKLEGDTYDIIVDEDAYAVSGDKGNVITINSKELKEDMINAGLSPNDEYYLWCNLFAIIKVEGKEVGRVTVNLKVREPDYEILEQEQEVMLGPSEKYKDGKIKCYVRNKEIPFGKELMLDIKEVKILEQKPESGNADLFTVKKEGNDIFLTGNNCGWAKLGYVLILPSGREKMLTYEKSVKKDIYKFDAWTSSGIHFLFPGEELKLESEVWHGYFNKETGAQEWEKLQPAQYAVTYEEWNKPVLKDRAVNKTLNLGGIIVEEDGTVRGIEESRCILELKCTIPQNGAQDFIATQRIPIVVGDSYEWVTGKVVAAPGQTVDVVELEWKRFDLEHKEGVIQTGELSYRFDFTAGVTLNADKRGFTVNSDVPNGRRLTIPMMISGENQEGDIYWPEEGEIVVQVRQDNCQHNFLQKDEKAATCTEPGIKTLTCSKCHITKTEAIPAAGHKPGVFTIVKEATCIAAGSQEQSCTVCSKVLDSKIIPAVSHSFSEWKVTLKATALKQGIRTRVCKICDTEEKQNIEKLKPTIKLNVKKIPLQVKKSTAAVKVISMTEGDAVKSWKSANKKVAVVTSIGKITGKRAGTAKITVTLKSGISASVTVKVQKKAVTTTKLAVTAKSMKKNKLTLKKGKSATLTAVRTPVTSKEKITYKSSNKKIIVVSSKGKITAKKVGKAKITVKSGKKKVVITVTVKK